MAIYHFGTFYSKEAESFIMQLATANVLPHLFNFFTLIPRPAATATSTATMKMSSEMVAIPPMKEYLMRSLQPVSLAPGSQHATVTFPSKIAAKHSSVIIIPCRFTN